MKKIRLVRLKKDLIYFGPGVHDFKGDSIHQERLFARTSDDCSTAH